MLAYGEIVYQESEIIEELKAEAIGIINQNPKKFRGFEIKLSKYMMDNYYKDLEDDLINQNSIGVALIRSKTINESINVFLQKTSFPNNRKAISNHLTNQGRQKSSHKKTFAVWETGILT